MGSNSNPVAARDRSEVLGTISQQMIDTDFSMTFHCRDLFKDLLDANNINLFLIEMSLSPQMNRQ